MSYFPLISSITALNFFSAGLERTSHGFVKCGLPSVPAGFEGVGLSQGVGAGVLLGLSNRADAFGPRKDNPITVAITVAISKRTLPLEFFIVNLPSCCYERLGDYH